MSTPEINTPTSSSEGNAEGYTPQVENGPQKGNREARYRTERNSAREELATAAARIERMQRVEVERIASEHLSMPGDLLGLTGNEVADYLDDDGNVDSAKVAADVAAVLTERPGLRKNAPAFDPTQGTGGNKPKASSPSWELMFQ